MDLTSLGGLFAEHGGALGLFALALLIAQHLERRAWHKRDEARDAAWQKQNEATNTVLRDITVAIEAWRPRR